MEEASNTAAEMPKKWPKQRQNVRKMEDVVEKMGKNKEYEGGSWGLSENDEVFFLLWSLKWKRKRKGEGKGQNLPFYNTTRENSPVVRLEPLCDQRSQLFNDF